MTPTRGRVLCLTPNFPRWEHDAVPNYVHHLAADLQHLGWRVDVLAPHAPGAARQEVLGGVHVERFRYLWPERAQTVCYGSGTLVNLKQDGSNARKIPFLVLAQVVALARRLRGGRYDLLHSHWALPQAVTGSLVARRLRLPHVVTCHGEEFHVLRGPTLDPFKRFGLHRADHVTVNSRATASALHDAAPRARSVHRIPMGVTTDMAPDDNLVAKIRLRHARGSGPLLLFTGRHVEDKGVDDLIDAMPILVEQLPGSTLVIAGDGGDRTRFEEHARAIGMSDRITFTGWVSDEEIPSYFAAADVFVAPSRPGKAGFIEGQGLTPLEAMVLGTPVVGTTLGGYADIVIDERTALAVPERRPDAIAAAVERLVRDPALAERLRVQGRAFALSEFSRSASAKAFSDLFERAVAEGSRRSR